MTAMHAIVRRTYGLLDSVELASVEAPTPDDDLVLVRVRAASLNPIDWHVAKGEPLIARLGAGWRVPKRIELGNDGAGVVESVGRNVTEFRPGDEVFGGMRGSFAELALANPAALAAKPATLSFAQAASLPVAGVTALQAVRDGGRVQSGQRVLVNGAGGGVGTFAVQIAVALGAEVTGICSTRNVELVRSLGATDVVDYTAADGDIVARGERFDVMIDNIGNRSFADCRRLLVPRGRLVVVGGPEGGRLIGPLRHLLAAKFTFALGRRKAVAVMAKQRSADFASLADMVVAGTVRPVVDRTIVLHDGPAALVDLARGHTRGKVVVSLVPE